MRLKAQEDVSCIFNVKGLKKRLSLKQFYCCLIILKCIGGCIGLLVLRLETLYRYLPLDLDNWQNSVCTCFGVGLMAAHIGVISPSTFFPSLRCLPHHYITKTKPLILASMSNDPIREWILSEGKATQITRINPIGGGCINLASRYDTDAGSFFVKTNRSIGPSMFEGEALGLGAMYETKTIRVPQPFKVGSLPTGGSFIIMEFIEFGASRGNQSDLGRKLAEMHKVGKSSKGFGFDVDNTIGSTPQINTWSSDWIQFYGEHRLGYQLKLALDQYGDRTIYDKGQRLVKSMGPLFDNVAIEPCLLHGDLWSGNIFSDKNGEPVILDPACYYGHNEAEFGMSWCAGFGGSFYNSYFEVMPKQPGFEKRRDLYMLYHYLNHYNLFGSGYRSSAMSIIDDYLAMLKA
ncbi:protein-ribulosamine 3-kinase, chloroplastic-like isoform X1 [Neltuma alba]|uniref:protein-ribulosamine 3-kinase, chloroplastic-like isoform X1 n=2 Tax=Neltuma alba TaxID=207710 RepID=UPI0010A4ACAA|nr:protein-ribulosamine 3-kinase, chloroplastic-like isoform X1 [Prosopis alba]